MSTYRSIRNIRRSISPVVIALLGGLALQFLLPTIAFASSVHIVPSPLDEASARAGVAVVRLLVTYNTLTSNLQPSTNITNVLGQTPSSTPTSSQVDCTGLGILVGSWAMNKPVNGKSTAPYVNWVLTDGTLINPSRPVCEPTTTNQLSLTRIDVLANDAYTNKASALLTLGSLQCKGTTSSCLSDNVQSSFLPSFNRITTNSVMLFSFISTVPQPFVGIVPATQNQTSQDALWLTDANNHLPPSSLLTATNLPSSYLKPLSVSLKSNQSNTSTTSTSQTVQGEPGTPSVNAAGEVVSIQSGGGPVSVAQTFTLLQQQSPLPATLHTNPLQQAWDKGIAAFFAKPTDNATATKEFALATNANIAFHGGTALGTIGTSPTLGSTPIPGSGQTGTPTLAKGPSQFLNLNNDLVLIGIGLLALIILIILLGVLLRGRARRREMAQFEAERQAAELQAHQQQQPLQAVPVAMMNQASGTPVQTTSLLCPNCQQSIRADAPYCPTCNYVLSRSASGQLFAAPPMVSEAPTRPVLSTVSQPPTPEQASISEQPTLQIHPDAQEETEKRQPISVEQLTGHNLSLAVGTRSDPGIKRKYKPNEDSVLAVQGARPQNAQLQQFGLFVVADGMGGHANGQDASRLAIQTIINYMVPQLSEDGDMHDAEFLKLLADGVQQANMAVHKHNQEQHADMGTTMTAALVIGSMAYVANVGDSRTYLYREPDGLMKVTKDHSVVASLVDAGVIKPDDIYTHPKRNQIYRSLGEKPMVEVDTFRVPLKPGDKLLLCSDGLWDMVRDPEIQRVMRAPIPDPLQTGDALIKAALDGGGEDNVSVIVVNISESNNQAGVAGIQLLTKPDSVVVPNMP